MVATVTQDRVIIFVQKDGRNTPMAPLSLDKVGISDQTMPGPGRNFVPGRDEFGRFTKKVTFLEPPGGLNTATLEEDELGSISYLLTKFKQQGCFPIQLRFTECGRIDGPSWNKLKHFGNITLTQRTDSAGPSREAAATVIFDSFEMAWDYTVDLVQHALTALTSGEDQNINDIALLSDLVVGCSNCLPGYEPDKIAYFVPNANAGSPGDFADVLFTTTGGSTIAATSAPPFAVGDNITQIEIGFVSDTQFRVIVTNDDTSSQLKWADITLGAEGTTSWSSAVTIGAAAEEALSWLFFDRLYIAVAGDIYISTDQGETFGSAIFTSANQINDIRKSFEGDVWAVGASNMIIRERDQSDTFDTLQGPSGGGAFTSIFIANDNLIYAGNGQILYLSNNGALNAGGWSVLKDFGSNKSVVAISCSGGSESRGGDSQLIRVVVDDTAGGVGAVWESEDGGARFKQVDALTNTGYNTAAFSPIDDNFALIGGDAGTVHKLSAKA